jgi:hypothetical protein
VVAQQPFMGILFNVDPREDGSSLEAICLTLILLTWRIWWAPNNASKWKMGFNSAFKGLIRRIEGIKVTGASGYGPLQFHQ